MARGSVFRKNGGWAFRVDAGFHAETGKRRQLLRQGFGTKRAAEEALAEAVGAATRGMAVSRSTVKVGEYLDDWFATARPSLRPTTARGYEQSIGRLTRFLGNYQLQALTPMQVQRCYTDLLESAVMVVDRWRRRRCGTRTSCCASRSPTPSGWGWSPATQQRRHARRPVRAPS